MNNDQQNTNQQPPAAPQATPTIQPLPSQTAQTANQQLQVNQPRDQHNDAAEPDLIYTNEHDANVHIARSFVIIILGLLLLIVIAYVTGLLSKHYGAFVIANIYVPFSGIVLFAIKSTRIGRIKLFRDTSLTMFFGDIILFIIAIFIGNVARSSPGSTRPIYYLTDPALLTLPINEVIEISFVYVSIITIFGVAYLVARAMYKKEIRQNRN